MARLFIKSDGMCFMQHTPQTYFTGERATLDGSEVDYTFKSVEEARAEYNSLTWRSIMAAFVVTDKEVVWL